MAKRGQKAAGAIKAVAYYWVSTDKQGRSRLGLEAQQAAVRAFLDGKGWPPLAEFTEVESGKRADRPKLAKAMAPCRLYGATLVIAKLDRLSRNAAFLLMLRDAGIEFIAYDMPTRTGSPSASWRWWPRTRPSGSAPGPRRRWRPRHAAPSLAASAAMCRARPTGQRQRPP